jgi:rhomboid protease GluP
MTPELLVLLAASLNAVQIVALILRREHVDDAPYLGLLTVNLALLVWVHLTGRHDSMIAFVAEGLTGMLTLAPRLLDGLERGALMRDHFERAARIAMLRELLTPGKTAARRRRQLQDLAQTREGGGLAVARRLREQLATLDATDRRAVELREELATVLFFDRRFGEGVEEVERHLDPTQLARRPAFAAYLVRAYGELGRLDRAGQILMQLEEDVAGRDPTAAPLLVQARLTFLAFAGRTAHLEALLSTPPGAYLGPRAHEFLLDTARARAEPPLEPEAARIAETVFQRASLPATRKRRRTPATFALIAVNVAVMLVLRAIASPIDDVTLARAGALFRPAVNAGEWWRLFTAMFLHAGLFEQLHLIINMYGLYLLGRFVEDVFGPARFLAVYLCAGLTGSIASWQLSGGGLSVGASGAIMGLLGALIVTLILRRGSWPEAWRRVLLGNLLMLSALQIYIGFQVALIDNAAHVGGMLGGAMATLVFAPGGLVGNKRGGTLTAILVAGILSALVVTGAVLTALTPLDRTIARTGTRQVTVGGAQLTVPSYWEVDKSKGLVLDPDLDVTVKPVGGKLQSNKDDDPRFAALLARIRGSALYNGRP